MNLFGVPLTHLPCRAPASVEINYQDLLATNVETPEHPQIPDNILDLLFKSSVFETLEHQLKPLPELPSEVTYKTFSDGTVFKGEIDLKLRKHGRGMEVRPDGTKYDGLFLKGLPHGLGRLIRPSLGVYQGEFAEGKIIGRG